MSEGNQKLLEGIAFFEQMLQTMPGDRTSLEFLAVAYEQTGESEKQRDTLIKLSDTLLREQDYDNAQIVAGHLSKYSDYPPAQAAVIKVTQIVQDQILKRQYRRDIESGVGSGRTSESMTPDPALAVHALTRSAASAEMDLVWVWNDREFVDHDICTEILHILTDSPITDTPTLVSAVALLDERYPERTEQLLASMQQSCDIPAIPLELVDPPHEVTALLPPAFMRIKGVVPFAKLHDEVLVALLNPLNKELQQEITELVGSQSHFFLAHPSSIKIQLEKIPLFV